MIQSVKWTSKHYESWIISINNIASGWIYPSVTQGLGVCLQKADPGVSTSNMTSSLFQRICMNMYPSSQSHGSVKTRNSPACDKCIDCLGGIKFDSCITCELQAASRSQQQPQETWKVSWSCLEPGMFNGLDGLSLYRESLDPPISRFLTA